LFDIYLLIYSKVVSSFEPTFFWFLLTPLVVQCIRQKIPICAGYYVIYVYTRSSLKTKKFGSGSCSFLLIQDCLICQIYWLNLNRFEYQVKTKLFFYSNPNLMFERSFEVDNSQRFCVLAWLCPIHWLFLRVLIIWQ
jgi:hypothetical protein